MIPTPPNTIGFSRFGVFTLPHNHIVKSISWDGVFFGFVVHMLMDDTP